MRLFFMVIKDILFSRMSRQNGGAGAVKELLAWSSEMRNRRR